VADLRFKASALNKATSDYFYMLKRDNPRTYKRMASDTGIGEEQLKKLFGNRATFKLGEFLALCGYFEVDTEEAMKAILAKVSL
jgi:hypothetical protein